uniref:Spondin domain-containing protein n=1 Tax=Lotharella globosa TaxID=91324 RepID=A0A7S3Z8Z6_9EUKA|mmetsp:Transcript_5260/g.9441  ORF Transcript_5260/g.9441 Transcript_5260/m.9441 type:complete len:240 (+) Transcript_5260:84-803(+)|eukprot:CAMPEP_0167789924 /NCGR_PEP_ID=MMETSP0111_2-20121227/10992_1 /TAXON_ID=91324 /ORGANISM="Lotharella globosa, Strain CCCM811" /LENGTH=239 /DNA_ID=CAMNT_0007682219 /DNA_START=81 /DNA_END=800 /DNA_ORIENTATION=+
MLSAFLLFTAAATNAEWAGRILETSKRMDTYTVRVDNLSFRQPLGGIFVLVHTPKAFPLFVFNKPASVPLQILAEDGNTRALEEFYKLEKTEGVRYVGSAPGAPPGQYSEFEVEIPRGYLLTIASMAINTNDCYVALNGVEVKDGDILKLDGLDAGTEENNELCRFIPGPACGPEFAGLANLRAPAGDDEGFVHVHRGFFGINEGKVINSTDLGASGFPLSAVRYDWRNPMAQVTIYKK